MHFVRDQSNAWCLFGKMKAPRIFYSVEMSNPFLCRSSSKFSKHIDAAPTTTQNNKPTNGKKNRKNDSFNIKADTQTKTKQHQTKTERYFLTPYPSSLKTQYVQLPFCWWAFAGGHTSKAIRLPGVSTQSLPRESIEVRMIAFFTEKKETAAVAADLGSLTKAVWEIWGFHVIGYVLVAGCFFWMNRVLQISFDFFEFLMDFAIFVSK